MRQVKQFVLGKQPPNAQASLPLVPAHVSSESRLTTEQFCTVNRACMRAIAGDNIRRQELDAQRLELTIPDSALSVSMMMAQRLSETTADVNHHWQLMRVEADVASVLARYHHTEMHTNNLPEEAVLAQLLCHFEWARCEAVAGCTFAGIRFNLMTWRAQHNKPTVVSGYSARQQLGLAIETLCLELLVKQPTASELQSVLSPWHTLIIDKAGALMAQLHMQQRDQQAYTLKALAILNALGVECLLSTKSNTPPLDQGGVHGVGDEDGKAELSESSAEPDTETCSETVSELASSDDDIVSMREEPQQNTITVIAPESSSSQNTESVAESLDAPVDAQQEAGHESGSLASAVYRAYTTEYDEIVKPQVLASDQELTRYRAALNEYRMKHEHIIGPLVGRLRRLLMAQQQRAWQFDLESGMLDTARLTRIITQPLSALSFKQEHAADFRDTTVTLLVDNSKSMLGKPIVLAAVAADILACTLERCGIAVEVLGFTTGQLHDGPVLEQWRKAGEAENPGRLNTLRHIIYKSAETPYRRARKGLGLMLQKELLKQNIDGEALLWANERLARRLESRKILLVISDGAPIDTSTLAANAENMLIEHLHHVIAQIEATGDIELLAIGIGHDVSQYYQRAITIHRPDQLSRVLLTQLISLFKRPSGAG